MSKRTWLLSLAVLLLVLGSGAYVWYQRSKADALPQASIDLTTGAALRGATENTASLEDVTVSDDGTIELAPAP